MPSTRSHNSLRARCRFCNYTSAYDGTGTLYSWRRGKLQQQSGTKLSVYFAMARLSANTWAIDVGFGTILFIYFAFERYTLCHTWSALSSFFSIQKVCVWRYRHKCCLICTYFVYNLLCCCLPPGAQPLSNTIYICALLFYYLKLSALSHLDTNS